MSEKTQSWIVRVKCEVLKDVICEDCTEKEARLNPFQFSVEELEVDMTDFEVLRIEENE